MGNLFTFGCSFSEPWNGGSMLNDSINGRSEYIEKYCQNKKLQTYSDYISDNLNLINKNYAFGGNSNQSIFSEICNR